MGISPAAMNYITSLADNATYQEIMKRTGVNLSFIHFHPDTQTEQFNLICAFGDYPDVMNGVVNQYSGGADKGIEDGDTIHYGPLEDGYKEYLEAMAQWCSDGLIYHDFPFYGEQLDSWDEWQNANLDYSHVIPNKVVLEAENADRLVELYQDAYDNYAA